jgi:hypothetical protein
MTPRQDFADGLPLQLATRPARLPTKLAVKQMEVEPYVKVLGKPLVVRHSDESIHARHLGPRNYSLTAWTNRAWVVVKNRNTPRALPVLTEGIAEPPMPTMK